MRTKTHQILIAVIFILPHIVFAQQKYFVFKYNNNFGMTNLDGTELIEGEFISYDDQIKDYAHFENQEGKQVLIHVMTGQKEVFDEFDGNSIFMGDQYFANVESNGKHFLWSQKTGERLSVPKILQQQSFQEVRMINKDFLYAVSYEWISPPTPKSKTKAVTKTKISGIRPPEKIDPPAPPKQVTYVYIFKNERSMPLVTKIIVDDDKLFESNSPTLIFDFYNLEKIPKENTTTNNTVVYVAPGRQWNPELKPWHFYYNADFNIACINKEDSIHIMDGHFKTIKTIPLKDRHSQDATKEYFQSEYPKDEISLSYADFSPSVSMPSSPKKPFWQIRKKENYYEIDYLKDEDYIPYLQLEASEAKIGYDNGLYIKDAQRNELMIKLNEETRLLAVPLKYKQQFKIIQL